VTALSIDGDIASFSIASLQETSYGLAVTGYGAAADLWPAAASLTFSSEAVAPLMPLELWAPGAEPGNGQIWITGEERPSSTEDVDLDGPAPPQPRSLDPLTGLGLESQSSAMPEAADELLILDAGVEEPERLLEGLRPGVEVVRLSGDRDGIAQISEALASRSGLRAVHVMAHGDEGLMSLGTAVLDAEYLAKASEELRGWGRSIKPGGDVLLYACNLAAGAKGIDFVRSLSEWIGADVAASDDPTGHTALGGDWDLEVKTGGIQATLPLSTPSAQGYQHTLQTIGDNDERWNINGRINQQTVSFENISDSLEFTYDSAPSQFKVKRSQKEGTIVIENSNLTSLTGGKGNDDSLNLTSLDAILEFKVRNNNIIEINYMLGHQRKSLNIENIRNFRGNVGNSHTLDLSEVNAGAEFKITSSDSIELIINNQVTNFKNIKNIIGGRSRNTYISTKMDI